MKKRLLIVLALIICEFSFGQLHHENIRLEVLNNDVEEKVFVYGKWNEEEGTETHLNYLGKIKSEEAKEYKIMTSCWFWGFTRKATNLILVFTNDNKFIGNYYLDSTCVLPKKIENNKLVFRQSDCNDCTNTLAEVNFHDGKPGAFYLGCKKGKGSILSFYNSI